MSDVVRKLTDTGIAQFYAYIASLRSGNRGAPPAELLHEPMTSTALPNEVQIERQPNGALFGNRYEFGVYLSTKLQPLDRRLISRDYQLWTWLALYYFDQLCAVEGDGTRKPLADEAYILAGAFKYDSYYRHLVRTAWLAVCEHGENSRVMLVPAGKSGTTPLGQRGEIIEQLAARQSIFGSQPIIEGAYRMYFDHSKGKPKWGAGGSGAGSPRRLALVVQQLDLNFDLRACSVDRFLDLLPKEFERWRKVEPAAAV